MNDLRGDDAPFDPGALGRRSLRAVPWAVGAALLAAGVAAFVDARLPPAYQASLYLRLAPPPDKLLEDAAWPGTPGEVQALLLGAATRAEVSKDPETRAAFGLDNGSGGEERLAEAFAQRISVFPGSGPRAVWVVARDPDPELARRVAVRVSDAGLGLFRVRLAGARDRLAASWDRAQAGHLEEIRRIDAELARPAPAGRIAGPRLPPAEEEQLLARRRVRVEALEEIERERLVFSAAADADLLPWTIEETSGAAGDLVPRDRIRPLAAPALFAAALAFLVRLLRDDGPSGA